ncbi:MAG: MarR family transcriptional regulator [Lachnospiraceae bacterium]|nr:MarR family transcriptional regulator [Lachnospiraceae bacterium]
MNINSEDRLNVLRSAFTLARSLKRRPAKAEHHFSPSVERSLMVIRENDGLTARDLSEKLDIRPSSVTELVNRLIETGLVVRKEDEDDRRLSHICLTDLGKAEAAFIEDRRKTAVDDFSACFTDEEAAEFCRLADKLSAHLREKEADGEGKCRGRRPEGCHRAPMGRGPHFGHGERPEKHFRLRRLR